MLLSVPTAERDPIAELADSIYNGAIAAAESATDFTRRNKSPLARLALTTALTLGVGMETTVIDHTDIAADVAVQSHVLEKNQGESSRAGKVVKYGAVGGAVAVGGAWLAQKFNDIDPFGWGKDVIPEFKFKGPQKIEMEAALHADTVKIEQIYKLLCNTDMSVAVGIYGETDGGTIHFDGDINKLKTVDVTLCGELDFPLTIYANEVQGITRIEGVYPTLVPNYARINKNSAENCVDADADTTKEELDEMVASYNAKVAEGKSPDCENGVHEHHCNFCIQVHNDNIDQLEGLGDTAAEIDATLDLKNKELIGPRQEQFQKDTLQYVRGIQIELNGYLLSVNPETTVIDLKTPVLTDDEEFALRIASAKKLLEGFKPIDAAKDIVVNDDGSRTLSLTSISGQKLHVTISNNWQLTNNDVFEATPQEGTAIITVLSPDGTPVTEPSTTTSTTEVGH